MNKAQRERLLADVRELAEIAACRDFDVAQMVLESVAGRLDLPFEPLAWDPR